MKIGDTIDIEGKKFQIVRAKRVWFHSSLLPLELKEIFD